MIKNIVFDIGQVLVSFQWKAFMEKLFHDKEIVEQVSAATLLSPLWQEIDRGARPIEEIIDRCVAAKPEVEAEIRKFYELKNQIAVEFPYSKDWVCDLKARGFKTYLLSNYSEAAYEYMVERSEFPKYMDGEMISYRVKYIKPEPEIYQALIDAYHIIPSESVFLDDVEANLEGARRFGFKTILVRDYKSAKQGLEELIAAESAIHVAP